MQENGCLRFNTYNPRRNLPPASGRKRGEANFAGAFERHFQTQQNGRGFGGRNFAFTNHGIADFVWVLPNKTGKAIANPGNATFYAFEVKLDDWKKAFRQAYRYSYYSDFPVVVMPVKKERVAASNKDLFKEHGIGLWLFDQESQRLKAITSPRKKRARNPHAREKALSALLSRVKLSQIPE